MIQYVIILIEISILLQVFRAVKLAMIVSLVAQSQTVIKYHQNKYVSIGSS